MDIGSHMRVRALIEVHRFDDAIRELKVALSHYPNDARALYLIGHCHLVMERPEEAEGFAEKALSLDAGQPEYHVLLAHALLNMHQPERAILHTMDAIRADPEHVEAHFIQGAALYTAGKKEEALVMLDGTLRLAPDHARALALRSHVLHAGSLHLKAAESMDAALRIDPGNPHTLALKAWSDFVHQRPGDHVHGFREVLRRSPLERIARRGLLLSSAPWPKIHAARERRAVEGTLSEDTMDSARLISFGALLISAFCFVASGLHPAFITFYGSLFIVAALFLVDTLACLLLLPSLLDRNRRELIPSSERNSILVGDTLFIAGAVWCTLSPLIRGMHSYWGLLAMLAGTMILSIRARSRTTDRVRLRWTYLSFTLLASIACMLLWKPHAYWVSMLSLVLTLAWFRFNRYVDKR